MGWVVRGCHRLALSVCLVALLGAGNAGNALAETKAQVAAGSFTVGVGATAMAAVTVQDVVDLYGVELQLSFDPAVLEVVDAIPAKDGVQIQPGDFLDRGFAARNTADNAKGTIWYGATQVNPSEPKSGRGTLVEITFRGRKASAGSKVTITSATLVSRNGDVIPATVVAGEARVVTVGQASTGPTGLATTQTDSATRPRVVNSPPPMSTAGSAVGAMPTAANTSAQASRSGTVPTSVTSNLTASGAIALAPTLPSGAGPQPTAETLGSPTSPQSPPSAVLSDAPAATWTMAAPAATAEAGAPSGPTRESRWGDMWLWVVAVVAVLAVAGLVYALVVARRSGTRGRG